MAAPIQRESTMSAQRAFALLGLMTLLIFIGAFIALSERAEAPVTLDVSDTMSLTLTSPAFEEGGVIPSKYTCDGENVSPELRIGNVPENTKTFVLVMDDPDVPDSVKKARGIEKFNHWAVYNIPADVTLIPEGTRTGTTAMNSRGEANYTGPCPPDREHRYIFRIYAVTGELNFLKAPTLDELETAAQGMMIERATLMGRYERVKEVTP